MNGENRGGSGTSGRGFRVAVAACLALAALGAAMAGQAAPSDTGLHIEARAGGALLTLQLGRGDVSIRLRAAPDGRAP